MTENQRQHHSLARFSSLSWSDLWVQILLGMTSFGFLSASNDPFENSLKAAVTYVWPIEGEPSPKAQAMDAQFHDSNPQLAEERKISWPQKNILSKRSFALPQEIFERCCARQGGEIALNEETGRTPFSEGSLAPLCSTQPVPTQKSNLFCPEGRALQPQFPRYQEVPFCFSQENESASSAQFKGYLPSDGRDASGQCRELSPTSSRQEIFGRPLSFAHQECAHCTSQLGEPLPAPLFKTVQAAPKASQEAYIPSPIARGHSCCVFSGAEVTLPVGIRKSEEPRGARETVALAGLFGFPEPDRQPDREEEIAFVEQESEEDLPSARSRSVNVTEGVVALVEVPKGKIEDPFVPVQSEPLAAAPQPLSAQPADPLQKPASRYPLYESDPSTFLAQVEQGEQEEEENGDHQGILINFQNLPMAEYVRFVGQNTGKNFIFNEEDLAFTVTIVSREPTTVENIMAALLQELRIHGLALVEQGNNLIIYKQAGIVSPAALMSPNDHSPPEIGTRVFTLNYSKPADIADIVSKLLSQQALVQVVADTNTLLVTDLAANIEKITQLINVLDVPNQIYDVGQYVAINSLITDLIPLAEQILAPISGGKPATFVPHRATNSVFIVSNSETIKQAFAVLSRLDGREGSTQILTLDDLKKSGSTEAQRAAEELKRRQRLGLGLGPDGVLQSRGEGGVSGEAERENAKPAFQPIKLHTKFYIHKLEYRKGDELVAALQQIAESLRLDEKSNQDLINAIYSVQWIEATNSMIITGTDDAVGRVKELIEELDQPVRQVFLEMLILDTTVADALQYSVDIADRFSSPYVGSAESFINNSSVLPAVHDNAAIFGSAALDARGAVQTSGFNLGIIGRKLFKDGVSFTTIAALVKALHSDGIGQIVLNPKIIVEDGYPAEVFVGEQTAFQTQVIANDLGSILTQNVEFRDVGASLKVTPQLGNGNIITLVIEQEVSAVISAQSGASATGVGSTSSSSTVSGVLSPAGPTTSKSKTSTKVHVPDGYFVILSGMIRDEHNRGRNQMPCLGGIPFLGAFVSNKNDTINKRNLMVFIRPVIIDEDWQYDEITRRQQDIYKERCKRKPRWKYEADEALDFLNLPHFNDTCWVPDDQIYY